MHTTYTLPPAAPFENHGKTRASWVFVTLAVLGALVIGIGLVTYSVPVQIAGVAVIVVGGLLGIGLRAAGKGQPRTIQRTDWYED
ncbi:MAG: HGxxPAAW family protein [Bowdeniella nasicola]|nr:HGxxPAAW family protein [Bowdeniella nasicola]